MRRSTINLHSFTQRGLKNQNADVVSQIRKTGLFKTNAEVIDAALRALVAKLKEDFDEIPEGLKLPDETNLLPVLPDLSGDGRTG